jgi:hypothetical protein
MALTPRLCLEEQVIQKSLARAHYQCILAIRRGRKLNFYGFREFNNYFRRSASAWSIV